MTTRPSSHGPTTRNRGGVLVLLLAVIGLSGCESAPKTGGLDTAIGSYERGELRAGYEQATAVMESTSGVERDAAAYVAALCAYCLDDLDEAELRLRLLLDSEDETIAARAEASLGLVRMRQGRYAEAAAYFEASLEGLEAADAEQSREFGDLARHYAVTGATGGWLPRRRPPALGVSAFTLQAGAFRDRRRAEAVAAECRGLATREGLGEVRIVKRAEDRGTLYLVQMGRFQTRQEAARLRGTIGRLDLIVASAG